MSSNSRDAARSLLATGWIRDRWGDLEGRERDERRDCEQDPGQPTVEHERDRERQQDGGGEARKRGGRAGATGTGEADPSLQVVESLAEHRHLAATAMPVSRATYS